MAYIPDKLGKRRRDEGVSQTAYECFVQYCEHADQETGITFATPKTLADALEMRSDNAKKYDDELQVKGWVELVIVDGKVLPANSPLWKFPTASIPRDSIICVIRKAESEIVTPTVRKYTIKREVVQGNLF
ncbi:MAG: hypothetical protein K1X72_28565 [Pyrinomonadaceae bacterium]|nr:hypothetical protein [Pyrinomonadaceae bacterium]